MTQRQQVLELFLEKGDVMIYELMDSWPRGLGISAYCRCIKELREGKGGAKHEIINVEPGHFRYIKPGQQSFL